MRIETERLILRLWEPDDVPQLAAIESQPDVAAMLAGPGPPEPTAAKIDRYMKHWNDLGFTRWAVELPGGPRLVGRVGIMRQTNWRASMVKDEIGWAIDRNYWGQGLATEAAHAALHDAFTRIGLPAVMSFTLPDNYGSRRVMEKCGLRFQGVVMWGGREHVW
jgi:RimJ/RimL family protein N-acetyltransferase